MRLLYIILSYERPKALGECIRTALDNTAIKPDMMYILDDCSNPDLQHSLLNFAHTSHTHPFPINLVLNRANLGVGHQFQTAYNLIAQHNPDIVCIIEGDYFFRRGWIDDVCALFLAAPHTIAIPGCDHADMYQREKTHGSFVELMKEQYGEDVGNRNHMYDAFDLDTATGVMKVFGASNSCGCQILHWKRIREFLFQDLGAEAEYWKGMNRGFHVGLDRTRASDAHMSGTHTYLHYKWMLKNGIDTSKHFAYLNIADASIAFHAANQGINGKLDPRFFPEGGCFKGVNGGHFQKDYDTFSRADIQEVTFV